MIRVMLVDDHPLMRQGTRTFLEMDPDMVIVAETGQGEEALTLARHQRPGVVLLDIRLHGSSGIDVARVLRQDLPEVKVLVLTTYPYETYVRALFAIGVHGYLLKTSSDTELIAAVRAVHQGETALSAEIAAQLAMPRRSGIAPTRALSEREREVLTLVGDGASNKEIGQQLGLKENTIVLYLSNIMAKLGARSRTDAVKIAVQEGIIVLEH